ncbi:transketolase [Plantactinospora sp. CA-294935]|uniref:transketolase n=1 Tax=Plantactinospora sp. CA-294935 TaxID=3240012 RepID=UPI003D8B75D8
MTVLAVPATGRTTATEAEAAAARIRHHVVDMCAGGDGGHLGGSLSCVDILSVLYFDVLRVDPDQPHDPGRDIFLLSKGHAAIALYATLAERGFLDPAELAGYGRRGSRLLGHPTRAVPGVELPTGSLGHGLALGLGLALSARLREAGRRFGPRRRTYVLLGDGELQEGSCWESVMAAASTRADHLVAVVDRNGLQLGSPTERICPMEPLGERFRSFGWDVREVDGHDHDELRAALGTAPWTAGRPGVVIARTVKGHGVPAAENRIGAHYTALSARVAARAHRDLSLRKAS